jgi:hypothetical protein
MQWKALIGAVALGLLVILFLKACLVFSGVNDGYYSESYGPGFVEALKRQDELI